MEFKGSSEKLNLPAILSKNLRRYPFEIAGRGSAVLQKIKLICSKFNFSNTFGLPVECNYFCWGRNGICLIKSRLQKIWYRLEIAKKTVHRDL